VDGVVYDSGYPKGVGAQVTSFFLGTPVSSLHLHTPWSAHQPLGGENIAASVFNITVHMCVYACVCTVVCVHVYRSDLRTFKIMRVQMFVCEQFMCDLLV